MTIEESKVAKANLIKRVKNELTPENCPYCGCYHSIRFSRSGTPIFENYCCDDMKREVCRISRKIFGEPDSFS